MYPENPEPSSEVRKKSLSPYDVALVLIIILALIIGMILLGITFFLSSNRVKPYAADFSQDTGTVLNIYCFNTEFQRQMEAYYPDYVRISDEEGKIGDVTVNWIIAETFNNYYEQVLDEALEEQGSAGADDIVDLFLVEPRYNAMKYIDADGICISMDELKLTAYTGEQYQYNLTAATDSEGNVNATTWQAYPVVYVYRKSVAREIFGTDDPKEVQKFFADWETFSQSAEKLEAGGFKIVSSYEETYRLFSQSADTPWVIDGQISIPQNMDDWAEQTKLFTEKGYNDNTSMWSMEWILGAGSTGNVFGYFGPSWFIEYVMPTMAEDTWGDWAACEGPQATFWGGSLLCAAQGTDNPGLVRDIMYQLTCNSEIMMEMAKEEEGTFVNNRAVMEELAASGKVESAFLPEQNVLEIYCKNADQAVFSPSTVYDYELDTLFQSAMMDYFKGYRTKEEALEQFYDSVERSYPELTHE